MLQLFDIRKSYTTADFSQTALDDVSISFRDNEFVAILGPSGSGKTTMLNIVGGLDHYDSGNLVIDGISTEQYTDRDWDTYRNNRIGFVFQSYNLIPHQTVLANVELALTLSGVSRDERKKRAKDALIEVGLGDHISKKPSQLSGGQMQRVAVARALINDPEILLADEPTGALDSTTSVQIMELLTQIAKDRLVIMVTHNPELADTYANRIVDLRDGKVVSDSNPFNPAPEDEKVSEKPIRRTAMSFLTAISLSFNNLMTKKGRTIMTAFAGSIGIIGIAAILALANGVNNYIKSVEEDTLSVYPLSIESTGIDMTSMMASMVGGGGAGASGSTSTDASTTQTAEEKKVQETKTLTNMFSRIGSNDLASLKVFLDSGTSGMDPYMNTVQYSYGIGPKIYSPDTTSGVRQVNPNTAFKPLSSGTLSGTAGSYASMMTSGGNTNIFHQMLNNPEILSQQYDVVAGKWPEAYNECVLVLNQRGGVNDYTLYAMGLRDPNELDEMVKRVANKEDVDVPLDQLSFSYDQIMGVTFKMVNSADMYQKDAANNAWLNKADDEAYMKNLIANGTDIKIVGIIQSNPDAAATSLSPGICYTSALQQQLIKEASTKQIVQEQLANPEVDVLTGRTFAEEKESNDAGFNMADLFNFDASSLTSGLTFDTSSLNLDFSGMDLSSVQAPPMDMSAILGQIQLTPAQMQATNDVMGQTVADFVLSGSYPAPIPPALTPTPAEINTAFQAYLADPVNAARLSADLSAAIGAPQIEAQVQTAMTQYMTAYVSSMMTQIQTQIGAAMKQSMGQLSSSLASSMNMSMGNFSNMFNFDMDEKQLGELMMSYMTGEENTYENILKKLGYADFAKPTSINIYPKDFEGKGHIIEILDDYNDRMKAQEKEDQVITYTDIVGTLMSSVTDIVNMVSYVLVAFVAISLVVSSIMIGIITYISVLERKKEIGILRSIGASKGDIGRVFNAETLIVGFVAGLIGIAITALVCIPANAIIYAGFGVANVAALPWQAAIVLILISMFLSFIAGLIPSSAASRKDPVEALRSE